MLLSNKKGFQQLVLRAAGTLCLRIPFIVSPSSSDSRIGRPAAAFPFRAGPAWSKQWRWLV
jgi:hypothetical protein